ncbi:MAG: nucleotide exchange factor GrpE [Marinilabiliaceae bacterium]|nr:nucleotide exchange factor GrpE [Marinilabiliaceae bacterium]
MSKKEKKEKETVKQEPKAEKFDLESQPEEVIIEEAKIEEESAEERSDFENLVNELNQKLADINDKHIRLSAEFDNYRKRTLKEKMDLTKSAGESVLKGILPVVDDFDRALAHLDDAKDLDSIKKGINLIYNKFKDFLSQQGVKEIEAKEKDFDTDLHEAITKIPAPTPEMKGKVVDCVEKGYLLNEKVIRFSKVVVGE